MTYVSRRSLLRGAAGTAVGLALAGPFRGYVAGAERGHPRIVGYGDLAPVADLRDGVERLDLPPGFQYRSFDARGDAIRGTSVLLPGRHDGMGAFPGPNGRTILVRNHEINGNTQSTAPGGSFERVLGDPTATGYDKFANGGTVNVDVDGRGNVVGSYISLNGTQMNCAGGMTPLGYVADVRGDRQRSRRRTRLHEHAEHARQAARLRVRGPVEWGLEQGADPVDGTVCP